ncbi:hypothetical protein BDV34DRAFT_221100 [Aspergillus parasiticus]|uniref:Uncharacterized protein n=2 Tax=Aspergillus parasiticus TaxID=5067 RepID=A0A5N6DZL8_ASPPA|nr:hypothetical protein BDV34DRAFT_221100 [Aspergillus parasiticus]
MASQRNLNSKYWWAEIDVSGANSSIKAGYDPIKDAGDHDRTTKFAAMTKKLIELDIMKVKIASVDNTKKTISYCYRIGPYPEGRMPTVDEERQKMLKHLEEEFQAPCAAQELLEEYWRRAQESLAQEAKSCAERPPREATPAFPPTPRIPQLEDDDLPEAPRNYWIGEEAVLWLESCMLAYW